MTLRSNYRCHKLITSAHNHMRWFCFSLLVVCFKEYSSDVSADCGERAPLTLQHNEDWLHKSLLSLQWKRIHGLWENCTEQLARIQSMQIITINYFENYDMQIGWKTEKNLPIYLSINRSLELIAGEPAASQPVKIFEQYEKKIANLSKWTNFAVGGGHNSWTPSCVSRQRRTNQSSRLPSQLQWRTMATDWTAEVPRGWRLPMIGSERDPTDDTWAASVNQSAWVWPGHVTTETMKRLQHQLDNNREAARRARSGMFRESWREKK